MGRRDYTSPEEERYKRPNYETAEEYNKARRAAGGMSPHDTTHTYVRDTNTATSYSDDSKKEKILTYDEYRKRKIILLIAVGVIVTIVMLFSVIANVGEDYEESETEYTGELLGRDDVILAEGFDTFVFQGDAYSLPMSYKELENMFVLDEKEWDTMLSPEEHQWFYLMNEEGDNLGTVRLYNDMEEDVEAKKCKIYYISFENDSAYGYESENPPLDLRFIGDTSFTSELEDFVAVLGTPTYVYAPETEEDGYEYASYDWYYYGEDGLYQGFTVYFWNGVVSQISIEATQY